ncbi:DUF7684 family protein [Terriglobus roseus]|uniref:DUF7684 domain-containing protein n=1 Tax=Terriglobus roseus TaxID=392734 RepID=A0A1G7FZH2_9BACT|nr:hypothetical protein [Terriglobus roseus]SDE81283.1 hypothetical protein SAMN05444167_0498 [Terriglobus roseus]
MIRTLLERKQYGRRYRVLHASTVWDLLSPLECIEQGGRFVAFFVAPDWPNERQTWIQVATSLLKQGLCYCCVWANGNAEGLHDLIDRIIIDGRFYEDDDRSVIMTTWHDRDGLAEAAFFFVHCAEPAAAYESLCHDWIAIGVGDSKLAIDTMKAVKAQLD